MIRVTPKGNQWVVTRHGRTISNHRLKRRAKKEARKEANPGETLEIREQNGRVQNRVTVR